MEQCIQNLAQAIQSGQLDPQMPIGQLVEQALQAMQQGGNEAPQEEAMEAQQPRVGLGM